jgi:hypothetical protein
MNGLGIFVHIQRECIRLMVGARDGVISLFELFQKAISPNSEPNLSFSSLSHRNIKVGGVENSGNSCVLSALLQELAALPDFYDLFLTTSLQQGVAEPKSIFLSRNELQAHLKHCVNLVRSGDQVSKKDVCRLSALLMQLGWQHEVPYSRRILHQWAPTIFPLPLANPYELFERVLALFSEDSSLINQIDLHQIALLSRNSSVSQRQFFEQSPILENTTKPILWRIAEDPDVTMNLEENFQIKNRIFSLKVVHVCQDTPRGKHVVVYRKEGGHWIYCNDARLCQAPALPLTNIYAVVYDSHT